jgi:beta-lactamase superfamily II metal-dependent hydrolase
MGKLHHLKVGCSDASVITTETGTFLVDCHRIGEFAHLLPANKKLRGVFVTHQHEDHYSGLRYLNEEGFNIDCLIHSPYDRRYADASVTIDEWTEFASLKDAFIKRGTKIWAPFRQTSFDEAWWKTNGITFWILGPHKHIATSDSRELHDACLVITAMLGKRKCVFTGDSSDASLAEVGATTTNICDDILHASHHGSINGADLSFIKKCNAKYTVISTEPGAYEGIPHPTALKRYADNTSEKVYRTDVDGSLTWTF